MAACSYMWLFIAGASTSGAVQASAALVSRLSARPWASFASVLADAGATQKRPRADQLEVGDRVVRRRRLARIGAAGRVALELVDEHRRAGDSLEGGAPYELQAGRCLDHAHGVASAGGEADQLHCLVRGDPAGNADQDSSHANRLPSGTGT